MMVVFASPDSLERQPWNSVAHTPSLSPPQPPSPRRLSWLEEFPSAGFPQFDPTLPGQSLTPEPINALRAHPSSHPLTHTFKSESLGYYIRGRRSLTFAKISESLKSGSSASDSRSFLRNAKVYDISPPAVPPHRCTVELAIAPLR